MLADRIEAKWIDAFCEIFERCAVKPGDTAAGCSAGPSS
jgi:2,5-dihydroxypyridine 5,6-dioxygenase